jgi:hypothetical protein
MIETMGQLEKITVLVEEHNAATEKSMAISAIASNLSGFEGVMTNPFIFYQLLLLLLSSSSSSSSSLFFTSQCMYTSSWIIIKQ